MKILKYLTLAILFIQCSHDRASVRTAHQNMNLHLEHSGITLDDTKIQWNLHCECDSGKTGKKKQIQTYDFTKEKLETFKFGPNSVCRFRLKSLDLEGKTYTRREESATWDKNNNSIPFVTTDHEKGYQVVIIDIPTKITDKQTSIKYKLVGPLTSDELQKVPSTAGKKDQNPTDKKNTAHGQADTDKKKPDSQNDDEKK